MAESKIIIKIDDLPGRLKWGGWDAVVSLGGTCQVAYQLKRLGLRTCSLPFDWIVMLNSDRLMEALETGLDHWLDLNNLHEEESDTECRKIIDDRYTAIHPHIFPKDRTVADSYDDIMTTVKRRSKRLLDMQGKDLDLLFVRLNMSSDEASSLGGLLTAKFGEGAYLLVINHTKEPDIKQLPSPGKNIFLFEIYDENEHTGQRWQGFDAHWDLIMANVELKGNDRLVLKRDILFTSTFPYEQGPGGDEFRWTRKESSVDLSRFLHKTVRIRLTCPSRVSLSVKDINGNELHKVNFGPYNRIRRKITGIPGLFEKEFDIDIDDDTRIIKLTCSDVWKPVNDDRLLGVCINSVNVVG